MKKVITQLLFIVLILMGFSSTLLAQDLPKFINITEDLKEIKTESGDVTGFYNESKLRKIYLEFEDTDYWEQLEANYDTDVYVKATLKYEDEILTDVGVQFKGNTSYTKLSDAAEKMSFAIKTDLFVEDQNINGYSNLNLNNAYQDNSTMIEVVYAHLCRNHIPAPQANFIELYINNEYWGPYTNVQQVNKDLLEDWFMSNDGARFRADASTTITAPKTNERPGGGGGGGAQWGDGTAALNYLGDDVSEYQKYYSLKSSDIENSWEKLVTVCDVLNNTAISELEETLKDYLDIDRTLWFLAHEIIYSDDDSYIYKGKMDYYAYYEPETGRFTPLEFDGNSAMNIRNVNWDIFMNEDNVNYPLLNRLLSIPSIRQRYLAHVRTILDEEMNLDEVFSLIDTYAALIDASVNADPKKLITYQEFLSGVTELKTYFTDRKAFLESDSEVDVMGLELSGATFGVNGVVNSLPYSNDQMNITVNVGTQNVSEVNLYYAVGIVGNFTKIEMKDDGNQNDGSAVDGIYGANIPEQAEGNYVRYYMEVIKNDANNTASYLPVGTEHSSFVYRVQFNSTIDSDIVINEVLAANDEIIADEAGEFDDYIELYNKSNTSISLEGYYLTDDISDLTKFALPTETINANGYFLIWADKDDEQGVHHANFKLNADGEELYLVNPSGEIVDALSFTNQEDDISYGRFPNGTGDFENMTPTPLATNSEVASVEFLAQEKFSMYPNPANQLVTIKLSDVDTYMIEIYTVTGKKVYSKEFTDSSTQIITNTLAAGTYFVRVNNQVNTLFIR